MYFKSKKEKQAQLVCLQSKKAIASPSGPAEHNVLTVEQHKVSTVERSGGCHSLSPRTGTRKGLGELDQVSFTFCTVLPLRPHSSLCSPDSS